MLRRPDIPSTLPRNTSTKDGKRRRSQAKGAGIRDARRCICKPAKATTCQGASHPHSLSAPRWNAGKGEEGLVPIQFKLAPFGEVSGRGKEEQIAADIRLPLWPRYPTPFALRFSPKSSFLWQLRAFSFREGGGSRARFYEV